MDADVWISPLVSEHRHIRRLPSGIFRAVELTAGAGGLYDGRAGTYDRITGGRFYNRFCWGTTPERYEAFAREAVVGQGPILDAGCGTMISTAGAFRRCNRAVIGVDLSMAMLDRAYSRVQSSSLIALVHADVFRLPFEPRSFETVLGMGMLHLFDDPESYLDELRRMTLPGGRVFISSLILSGRSVGDRYLKSLVRMGEVARARSAAEVVDMLARVGHVASAKVEGNWLFAAVDRPLESRAASSESATRGTLI